MGGDYKKYDYADVRKVNNRELNDDNIDYLINVFRSKGMDDMHIAVLVANIIDESGGDPLKESPDSLSVGLLQWKDERYDFNEFDDDDPDGEMTRQIDLILNTLDNLTDRKSWTHGGKGTGYNSLVDAHNDWVNGKTIEQINKGLSMGYVRPKDVFDNFKRRTKTAEALYGIISESNTDNNDMKTNKTHLLFGEDEESGSVPNFFERYKKGIDDVRNVPNFFERHKEGIDDVDNDSDYDDNYDYENYESYDDNGLNDIEDREIRDVYSDSYDMYLTR